MQMRFFEVTTMPPDGDPSRLRTWLVIADSEAGARRLVPVDMTVKAVTAGDTVACGPSREIGWFGPSPWQS